MQNELIQLSEKSALTTLLNSLRKPLLAEKKFNSGLALLLVLSKNEENWDTLNGNNSELICKLI